MKCGKSKVFKDAGKIFSADKGIAPLVSTILLISFAVILGLFVMGWGKSYEPSLSSDKVISIDAVTLDNKPMVCYTENTVMATLENDGNVPISGLKVSTIGDEVLVVPIKIDMPVGNVAKVEMASQNPDKVIVVPKIGKIFYPEHQIEIENINRC